MCSMRKYGQWFWRIFFHFQFIFKLKRFFYSFGHRVRMTLHVLCQMCHMYIYCCACAFINFVNKIKANILFKSPLLFGLCVCLYAVSLPDSRNGRTNAKTNTAEGIRNSSAFKWNCTVPTGKWQEDTWNKDYTFYKLFRTNTKFRYCNLQLSVCVT